MNKSQQLELSRSIADRSFIFHSRYFRIRFTYCACWLQLNDNIKYFIRQCVLWASNEPATKIKLQYNFKSMSMFFFIMLLLYPVWYALTSNENYCSFIILLCFCFLRSLCMPLSGSTSVLSSSFQTSAVQELSPNLSLSNMLRFLTSIRCLCVWVFHNTELNST